MRSFMMVLSFALWIGALHQTVQAEPDRTISSSGEAIVNVVPDEAILSFGLQTVHAELAVAKNQNTEHSQKLSEAIKGLGIEPRHFATDNMKVAIRYEDGLRGQGSAMKIAGYEVLRTYMVTLKDLSKLQNAVDTILNSHANIFEGVEFRSSELRKHRDEARRMAVKAAREKAEALAAELNCKIGKPRTITEVANHWGIYGGRTGMAQVSNAQMNAPAFETGEFETLPLGQLTIKANVNVTFDLVADSEDK